MNRISLAEERKAVRVRKGIDRMERWRMEAEEKREEVKVVAAVVEDKEGVVLVNRRKVEIERIA